MTLLSHAVNFALAVMPESFWLIILGSAIASATIGIALSVFEGVQ